VLWNLPNNVEFIKFLKLQPRPDSMSRKFSLQLQRNSISKLRESKNKLHWLRKRVVKRPRGSNLGVKNYHSKKLAVGRQQRIKKADVVEERCMR
jgi:hypothetical protein